MSFDELRRIDLRNEQLKVRAKEEELRAAKLLRKVEETQKCQAARKITYQQVKEKILKRLSQKQPVKRELFYLTQESRRLKNCRQAFSENIKRLTTLRAEQEKQVQALKLAETRVSKLSELLEGLRRKEQNKRENGELLSIQEAFWAENQACPAGQSLPLGFSGLSPAGNFLGGSFAPPSWGGRGHETQEREPASSWDEVAKRIELLSVQNLSGGCLEIVYRSSSGRPFHIKAWSDGVLGVKVQITMTGSENFLWREREALLAAMRKAGVKLASLELKSASAQGSAGS